MVLDITTKEKAVKLRKEGRTYSEILKEVRVAKSTLSLWLRDVGLAKKEFQRLTQKKLDAARRGGEAKRAQRLEKVAKIKENALNDLKYISRKELWLIGVVLYWAEGSKEKEYHPGSRIAFGNSDAKIIRVFLKWLREICKVSDDKIEIEVYIHENSKNNVNSVRRYWADVTGFTYGKINKIYYKKNKIKTNRKNIGDLYYGGVRVTVKSSSTLVRQIAGWSEAIFRLSK